MTHLPVSLPSQKTEMSNSTDDEAYDYDETGHGSDDYSDDFGDETAFPGGVGVENPGHVLGGGSGFDTTVCCARG